MLYDGTVYDVLKLWLSGGGLTCWAGCGLVDERCQDCIDNCGVPRFCVCVIVFGCHGESGVTSLEVISH